VVVRFPAQVHSNYDDRKVVEFGTLTINKAVADSDALQRNILFLPGRLRDGIEPRDGVEIEVNMKCCMFLVACCLLLVACCG
jgi:hypothetical protein